MKTRLQGKVVLITGGASGVGLASSQILAEQGARVVVADIDEATGREQARQIGAAALFVRLNITEESDWQAAMAAIQDHFGRLDAVVNNAGIFPTQDIEHTTLQEWRSTLAVNADGAFLGCKYAIAALRDSGGAIVNIASTAAVAGHPGMCAYSASKGAVAALTRNVAAHCRSKGYRIRCNTVIPGGIRTPITESVWRGNDDLKFDENPGSPFCEPQDVAHLIAFLISDESRYINGAEMRVDNAFLVALG